MFQKHNETSIGAEIVIAQNSSSTFIHGLLELIIRDKNHPNQEEIVEALKDRQFFQRKMFEIKSLWLLKI